MTKSSVTIVGAGFSGLTLAYFLHQKGLPVTVIEAENEVGGMLQSRWLSGYGLSESAANAILTSPLLEALCSDIGLSPLPSQRRARRRYIWWRSRAQRWPLGVGESLAFLFRLLIFFFRGPAKAPRESETVQDWAQRNFTGAFLQKLLAPALLGIYGSDTRDLSARLVLGRFFGLRPLPRLEPWRRPRPKSRRPSSVSFAGGMGAFAQALKTYLEGQGVAIKTSTPVSPAELRTLAERSRLVLATSLPAAARFASVWSTPLASEMSALPMRALSSGTLFYSDPSELRSELRGFGLLFAKEEKKESLGVLFNHDIFPGRVESPHLRSETWILRNARTEKEFLDVVARERQALTASAALPRAHRIVAWPQAFPVYSIALENFLLRHPELPELRPGVYLTGNYLGHLGLAQILEYNEALALWLREEKAT